MANTDTTAISTPGKKEETRERPDMVRARITRAKVEISAPRVFRRVTVVRVETKAETLP